MKYHILDNNIVITKINNINFNSVNYHTNYSYNPTTNKSSWIATDINNDNPIILKNITWKIIQSKKYNLPYFYNKITKNSQWNIPLISDNCTGKLLWTGNSCYMDSVLQALFIVPNYFTDNLLKMEVNNSDTCYKKQIQIELQRITNTIRNNTKDKVINVSRLRDLMKTCPDPEQLWNTEFHDAGEFLQYILDLFPNTNIASKQVNTYGTNELDGDIPEKVLTSIIQDNNASIIVTIDPFSLINMESSVSTQDLITIKQDSGELDEPLIPDEGVAIGQQFKRQLSETIIIDSPIIILNVLRNNPIVNDDDDDDDDDDDEYSVGIGGSIIETSIFPNEQITIQSGKIFNLSAIVVFRSQHYVCYYKCNKTWYFYNDMDSGIISKLLNFEDIFTTLWDDEPEVQTRGTLYFYVED